MFGTSNWLASTFFFFFVAPPAIMMIYTDHLGKFPFSMFACDIHWCLISSRQEISLGICLWAWLRYVATFRIVVCVTPDVYDEALLSSHPPAVFLSLSLSFSLSLCLSVCLPLSLSLSLCLSVCLPLFLSLSMSVCLSLSLSLSLCLCLSVILSFSLSLCLSVCLSLYVSLSSLFLSLSMYLSVCLPLFLSLSLYVSVCLSSSLSLSLYVSVCLSFSLSLYVSVCLSLSQCLSLWSFNPRPNTTKYGSLGLYKSNLFPPHVHVILSVPPTPSPPLSSQAPQKFCAEPLPLCLLLPTCVLWDL